MQLQSKQDISLSITTLPDRESAEKMAQQLVEEKLAACVSIIEGVNSIYTWEDKLEKSQETLLLIKSQSSLSEKLAQRISELHSYDNPEFILMSAEKVSEKYAAWVNAVTANTC